MKQLIMAVLLLTTIAFGTHASNDHVKPLIKNCNFTIKQYSIVFGYGQAVLNADGSHTYVSHCVHATYEIVGGFVFGIAYTDIVGGICSIQPTFYRQTVEYNPPALTQPTDYMDYYVSQVIYEAESLTQP